MIQDPGDDGVVNSQFAQIRGAGPTEVVRREVKADGVRARYRLLAAVMHSEVEHCLDSLSFNIL